VTAVKNLLIKEFRLAMHPTAVIFLSLSTMLVIPNYPYYITFFYTGLAVFFTCLGGRENGDVAYSAALPVRKADIVRARYAFVVLLELAQVLTAIPFALLRRSLPLPGNLVGMDANIAFFGLALVMLGLFNLAFFAVYYRDVNKVGAAFAASSAVVALYMIVAETSVHVIPFVRDVLDTRDPEHLGAKLAVLGLGMVSFAALTFGSYRRSAASFEALDL
jgi:hypothetical protein